MKNLEQKVPAAGLGGAIGLASADLLDYFVSVMVYGGAETPAPVSNFLGVVVPAVLIVLGGWLAPHTERLDLWDADE